MFPRECKVAQLNNCVRTIILTHTHVCMHTRVHMMYTCTSMKTATKTCLGVHMLVQNTHTHARMQARTCTFMHSHTRTHACAHTHSCTHTYKHVDMKYAHTCIKTVTKTCFGACLDGFFVLFCFLTNCKKHNQNDDKILTDGWTWRHVHAI